jgi:HK97 gp10 family phage protein
VSVRVGFTGGRALEAKLLALGEKVARKAAGQALKAAAEPIRERARSEAPDDPANGAGNFLVNSIAVDKVRRKGDVVKVAVGIDQTVDPPVEKPRQSGNGSYRDPGVAGVAVIIEFGRDGVPANGFMRRTWDAEKDASLKRVGDALAGAIAREAK